MMKNTTLKVTGFVLKSGRKYESICPELDVASFGKTPRQARESLIEACQLHVESAIENNLPYLRPIPMDDHPLSENPERIVDRFTLTIEVAVKAHA
jgi:predicted RNase H-like HicB family nuclease